MMDAEKLKELTDRAEKARGIAEELRCLGEATAGYRTGLTRHLEAAAFEVGRKKLIEQKEAELSELLGENKVAVVIPPQLPLTGEEPKPFAAIWCGERPPQDHHLGTLDSSDTWEAPYSPLETQVLN